MNQNTSQSGATNLPRPCTATRRSRPSRRVIAIRGEMTSAASSIPMVQRVSTMPKPMSSTPSTSSTKMGSAGIDADMKTSEVVATAIVSASRRSSKGTPTRPARASRSPVAGSGCRRTDRGSRRRRDDEEARRVDEHRSSIPPSGDERAAGERADREADVARRLDDPVRRLDRAPACDGRDEGELGRLRERDAAAEEPVEREHALRAAS